MSGKGHIPVRRCVACGATRPRDALVRLTVRKGSAVVVDATGRLGGRGAYVCRTMTCVDRVTRRGLAGRAVGDLAGRPLSDESAGLLREMARGNGDGQAHL